MKFFKVFALMAIVSLAILSCQEGNDNEVVTPKSPEPQLPATIKIVSAQEMPAEIVQTRAVNNIQVADVAGSIPYNGLLYDVEMNNNPKDDVQDVKIDITAQGANKFKFYLRPFRVGSMPGTLSVKIDNLTLNADGTFHADEQNDYNLLYEKLTIATDWLGTWHYNVTLIDGSFVPVTGGYRLRLTLESRGTIIGIEIFKAHVKYDGQNI